MNAFVKKQDFNYIKKCLLDLNNTVHLCIDKNIIEAKRSYIQDKIYNLFTDLSPEQKEAVTINIADSIEIESYLNNLERYVYGMNKITETQIKKLFRKEKKLKIPSEEVLNSKNVYLSWTDECSNKMFIVYNLNNKLVGMTCTLQHHKSNTTHICSVCNRIGYENEVAFVSTLCKTNGSKYGNYKSMSFHICLDGQKCNDSVTSIDKLEEIIKEVNSIK